MPFQIRIHAQGEPPFYDLDPTEALEAITEATDTEIRLKPGSSADAIHFVEMCLKHDPQERYSASELLKVRSPLFLVD